MIKKNGSRFDYHGIWMWYMSSWLSMTIYCMCVCIYIYIIWFKRLMSCKVLQCCKYHVVTTILFILFVTRMFSLIWHPRCSQKGHTEALQLLLKQPWHIAFIPEKCGKAKPSPSPWQHFNAKEHAANVDTRKPCGFLAIWPWLSRPESLTIYKCFVSQQTPGEWFPTYLRFPCSISRFQ